MSPAQRHPAPSSPSTVVTLAVALLATLAAGGRTPATAAEAAAPKPVALGVEKFDATLYRISGSAAGGVMVLVGSRGLLLVDSEDAAHAAVFDSVLRTISTLPVAYIVNTHYHYDHVGGNARYREQGATIVAQSGMWAQAEKDTVIADWGNWHREAAPPGAKPQITFDDTLTLDFEGDPVVLTHVAAAHTDDDVMVHFPGHNVLHTGDVVEIGAAPFIDLWAGGSPGGMLTGLFRFLAASNDSTRIVPGHGAIISRAELRDYRTNLAALASLASESIAEGRDLKAFLALETYKPYAAAFGSERGTRQLAALMFYGLNGMSEAARQRR